MMPDEPQTEPDPPSPDGHSIFTMAYHRELLEYLRTHEKTLWDWFSSHKMRAEAYESVRRDLLKTAYRIDEEAGADAYAVAKTVATEMGLHCPVVLYQAQQAAALNSSIASLPGEAHVIFHGPVLDTLAAEELSALLAHELAHFELQNLDDGAYLVVEQILSAMIADSAADAPHDRTWRSFRLYTELYCDRRAAQVAGDIEACIRTLVKMETGLKEVSAAAYLKQADEVLAGDKKPSDGITHPEMFIRAKALQIWRETPDDADHRLQQLVEGPLELKQLDLLRQRKLEALTEQFVRTFLAPSWMHTRLMHGHAKRFVTDFEFGQTTADLQELRDALTECDEQLQKYFCFVLLDFVTCDALLEEAPLAAAFLFVEELGLLELFRDVSSGELKLGKRAFQKVEHDADKIVELAKKEFAV